jgi:hypothetical protein
MDTYESEAADKARQEEAAFIAKFKAEYDPVAAEAELRDLLEQSERGELIPFEQILKELGIDVDEATDPA